MGAKDSKLKACNKCGQVAPVGITFEGICKSCTELKIESEREEIKKSTDKSEVERVKLLNELDKRKREAELELKEREARLEKERREADIATKKAEQMALLEVRKEKLKADHDQELQEDKEKHLEIKRILDAELNKSKIEEEKVLLECKKKLRDAELIEKKRNDEIQVEYAKLEKDQALKHAEEIHQLKMKLNEKSQEHDQDMAKRKLELDSKLQLKQTATIVTKHPSGETTTFSISGDLSPKLAAILISSTGTQESIQATGVNQGEKEEPSGQSAPN